MTPTPIPLPVKRVLEKTLLPDHGRYSPGHQVRVILGSVAHKVAEPQLPGLWDRKATQDRVRPLRFPMARSRTQ